MLKKIIGALAVLGILATILLWTKISLYLASQKKSENGQEKVFYFDAKIGLYGLADKLVTEKIISDKAAFIQVGEYKNLDEKRLASGKYLLKQGTKYKDLLNGFTLNANGNGNAEVEVEVTFNNCKDLRQVAQKVSANLQADSAAFYAAFSSPEILKKYQFTTEQLPALFLPNTYRFYWDTEPSQFIERMATEFKNFWTAERLAKLQAVGLKSPSEAVTLASIVYSEQGRNTSEWPIIARLYLNRVEQGMMLQSDPTFKFCWGDQLNGVQRLTYEHRDIDCPYNTYKYTGLPPGPICIPPSQVVDAVLNPAQNDFLFMIAKPNYSGLHDFSKDYATHAKNAKIYQRWLADQL